MSARVDLTAEQKVQVEALAAYLTSDQIADYFGVARSTWYSILERDPEVFERYKRGKADAIRSVAGGLLQKARDGDTTSAIFYLKTQAGWRETSRVEHTGPDGGPVQSITRKIIDPAAGD
jgi:IS30 family transposase